MEDREELSASFLNSIDASVGLTAADKFFRFKFDNIKKDIMEAAMQGRKNFSFYAPTGINMEPYFPGCSITVGGRPVSGMERPDPESCYRISWGITTGTTAPHSSIEYCDPMDRREHRGRRRFASSVSPPRDSGIL